MNANMYWLLIFFIFGFATAGNFVEFQHDINDKPQYLVGASYAAPGEFPYNIYWSVNQNYQCGGALISSRHVVTAAHCIKLSNWYPNNTATVTVGSVKLGQGTSYNVIRKTQHPLYDPVYNDHDIGILTLDRDVHMSTYVSPVKLPTKYHGMGEYAIITGFGVADDNVQYPVVSNELRKFKAPLMDYTYCNKYHNRTISQGEICTLLKKGVGTCMGDSGSPVVSEDGELVGVVSWGQPPCGSGYADVHANVYYYLSFIRNNMV